MFDFRLWADYLKQSLQLGDEYVAEAAAKAARLLRIVAPALAAKLAPMLSDAKLYLSTILDILETVLAELESPRIGVASTSSYSALCHGVDAELAALPAEAASVAAPDPNAKITPGDIVLIIDAIKFIGSLFKKKKAQTA